ncbi:MAG: FAD-binding oxidoreductase [Robiginitomaculum sp.]
MPNPSDMTACLAKLKSVLPAKSWSEDGAVIGPHLLEWRDKYNGHTPILLLPENTQEVSLCVKICAAYKIPIMPQGGNTGLVGGNTPRGEILLCAKRLNTIHSVNAADNIMVVGAGVTLLEAQMAAQKAGRKFPLSLASEGSCTIGGNLATNAGGVHVIKYGSAKNLAVGVKAVLPDGKVFNGITALKKDNTGYDLSRLFMGSEGTLGIITAVSLKLFPKPSRTLRAMVALNTPQNALTLLGRCHSPALTMFELMPRIGIEAVTQNMAGHTDPFDNPSPWYGLIDWEYFGDEDGANAVEKLLASALEDGLITDAVIAQNDSQAARLLALREHMSAAQKTLGASIKHDISVPVSKVAQFIDRAQSAVLAINPHCRPFTFGHMGDGNIHFNVTAPIGADRENFLKQWDIFQAAVHDVVDALGGSISAEHGIGIMKRADLHERADPVKLELLRAVKMALDPDNIMNPRVLI